jgi:hypothetical protein
LEEEEEEEKKEIRKRLSQTFHLEDLVTCPICDKASDFRMWNGGFGEWATVPFCHDKRLVGLSSVLVFILFSSFFLTCPHKRGEGGFELVTSAS